MNSELRTPWLHIPMEIVDRELYPKLFLACEAVQNGWQCILGTKRALIDAADQLPAGIVYLKSVIPSEIGNMTKFKKAGHRLVSLDEEGLVQSSLETLVTARYCNETIALTEQFFCWGDIQREALQKAYKSSASKFITTGSPTADLWSLKAHDVFDEKVAELHSRFGKYILIPSSFGVPNHFMGPEEALGIMVRDNMFRDQADYDYYKGYHDHVGRVFERFLNFLPLVAKEFHDYTIIVRPHPSEDHSTWKRAVEGLDNVKVLFEGPVSPWLLGAEAVLHWGSTTGIEAYLMGRPVIAYSPYPDEEKSYDVLPHLVSIMTHNPEDVLKVIHDVLDHPKDWLPHYPDVWTGHQELKKWIHNMDNRPAIKNLIEALNSMNLLPQFFEGKVKSGIQTLTFKEAIWRVLDLAGKIPRFHNVVSSRVQLGLKSRAFGRQKTKDISEAETQEALNRLSAVPIVAQKLGKNLFWIKPA